jgi:PBP1b-binding outer membrane lipoprotein LpoB
MNAKRMSVTVLLALLLGGCVATPAGNRDRIGDFVTNIASATQGPVAPATTGSRTA